MSLSFLLLLAAQTVASSQAPWFTDVTAVSGLPSLKYGEGVNIVDLDGDGLPELFLPVPRGRSRLMYNCGVLRFEDVTEAKGLGAAGGIGAVVGDLDGDGRPDIYVVRGEHVPGNNGQYLQRPDGSFADRSSDLGAAGGRSGISALLLDADGDGATDVFVAGWGANFLYRGNEPAQATPFVDATASTGLGYEGKCWGGVSTDFDGDGRPDLGVACGARGLPAGATLYRNRGDGTFENWTTRSGMAGIDWALGVVSADFHGQGRFDLFVTNLDGPDRLYRNDGGGHFTDVTAASGIQAGKSVGATAGDIDGDLLPDLVVAGFTGPVQVYRNLGAGRFVEVSAVAGLGLQTRNDGIALADMDGDGDLDLYVANFEGQNRLYRNNLAIGRYLKLRFAPGGSSAIGAVARLYRGGGLGKPDALLATLELQSTYGVCSQGPLELIFHLPGAGGYDLSVTYPDGTVVTKPDVAAGVLSLGPIPRRKWGQIYFPNGSGSQESRLGAGK